MRPKSLDAMVFLGSEVGCVMLWVDFFCHFFLLGQWLNFKLFGVTYLVGKIKLKLFFQGPLAE